MENKDRINKEKKFWDKIANKYDNQTGIKDRIMYKDLIAKIKNELKGEENILEMACGTGIITLEIAECVKNVIGIDISEKMIQIAKEKLKKEDLSNVQFKIGDGYSTNFEDKSFDMVLLCNVLHIVEDPIRLLNEAKRVLKDEGVIITSTDCYGQSNTFKAKLQNIFLFIANKLGVIPYVSWFRENDLIHMLKKSGFDIIKKEKIKYLGLTGYYIKAKK